MFCFPFSLKYSKNNMSLKLKKYEKNKNEKKKKLKKYFFNIFFSKTAVNPLRKKKPLRGKQTLIL